MIGFSKILSFIIFVNVACALLAFAGITTRDPHEMWQIYEIKNEVMQVVNVLKNINEGEIIQFLGASIYLAIVALKLAIMLIIFAPIITANTVSWLFSPFGMHGEAISSLFMILFYFSFIIWVIQIIRRGEIT